MRPAAKPSRRHQRKQLARRRHQDKHSSDYLPGLDGLRALAVLAVLVYHARPEWLPGGFLGVEVFFVISGFIITRSLLNEWQTSGRISLRAFWLRRARRLLPALFLLLAGVMTYAALIEPEVMADLRVEALAALGYVTNWQLILGGQSYFESFEKPSMLRHLWSLAIEEQFYVVWPLLLAVCLPLLKRRLTLLLIAAGIVAASVAMALLYTPGGDASRVYYGTDTRAGGLLAGAALAFLLSGSPLRSRRAFTLLGVAALAALVLAAFALDEGATLLYCGGFLAVSALSTAVILAVTRPNRLSRLLGIAPLRWLGVRSYAVYLWHWPVFLLTWPEQPGLGLVLAQTVAVIAIAAVSYQLFERPVRQGALGRIWQDVRAWGGLSLRHRASLALGGSAALAAVLALASVAGLAKPPERPGYFALESIRIQNTAADSDQLASQVPASNFMTRVESSLAEMTHPPLPCPRGGAIACGSPSATLTTITPPGAEDAPAGDAALLEVSPDLEPEPEPQPPAVNARPLALPEARSVPPDFPTVTAIGDSVMLGAATTLAGTFPNIDLDSEVGRQTSNAIALLHERLQANQLSGIVVLHLGNNGSVSRFQFDEIMSIIGPERQAVFVNVQVPRDWQDPNNAVLAEGVARHANASLVDWHGATMDHPELFAKDGIHLGGKGALLYTRLIVNAVLN